jgi:hypothetical protein
VIEAIGPSNQSHIWSITFETAAAKQLFVAAGDFFVGGRRAVVAGSRPARTVVRVHWVRRANVRRYCRNSAHFRPQGAVSKF